MTTPLRPAAVVAALCATAPAVCAQEPTPPAPSSAPPPAPRPARRHLRLGPDLGFYLPASARVRDLFGSNWTTFGLGIGRVQQTRTGGQFRTDIDVTFNRRGTNRIFLAPVGLEYRMPFGQANRPRAYLGAGGNAVFADMRVDSENIRPRQFRVGAGASLFGGVEFAGNGFIEARYRAASTIRGLNLSGTSIQAGIRF